MNFKDLVSKLDELVGNPPGQMPKIPARPDMQKNPLGTGAFRPGATVNPAQAGQADPQAAQTPPGEKPIPGQQPNLGPKPVTPTAPQPQVIGAPPAPQQQQQNNTGMAAAILQAVNQMKTQQPALAPTSSQSISAQQQAAVKQAGELQQTAKPGEPLEEVQVDEWGDWRPEWMGGPKKGEPKTPKVEPSQLKDLDDAGIENWTKSLSSDPNNVTHPNWKNVSPASKQKIISALTKTDPNAAGYIEAIRKHDIARKQPNPNEEELAALEKEKADARLKWNTPATEPAKTEPAKTEPTNKEPVIRSPINKDPAKTEPAKTEPSKTEPAKTEPKAPIVTSAELQKFRDEQGNQNITLGQYLNHKNNLTARKGGANDAEVIQKQLGDKEKAWNPDAKTTDSSSQDSEFRQQNLDRIKKMAGVVDAPKDDLQKVDVTPREPIPTVVVPGAEKPVEPTKVAEPVPAEKKDGYKPIKTDASGKTYIDLFNIGKDYSKNTNLKPGEGPEVRQPTKEPVPVVDKSVKEAMQSLVDQMLAEEATLPMTQLKPSAWNKTKDIVTTAHKVIPKPVRDAATVVGNVPGVKPAVRGVVGGLGAMGAVADTVDAYDRYEKGDYKGAAIRGIGAIGGAAQMAKHPVAVGLGFAAQQGADYYLDKYDAERAAEKNGITKEDQELSDILALAGKVK